MVGELLCNYESEKGIARIRSGKTIDTKEKLEAALDRAAKLFDKEIQKQRKGLIR